ncbi:UNVERIFIED_CONTAM: hypothetical protein NCL1_49705 [Trichonephila clavipes]
MVLPGIPVGSQDSESRKRNLTYYTMFPEEITYMIKYQESDVYLIHFNPNKQNTMVTLKINHFLEISQ